MLKVPLYVCKRCEKVVHAHPLRVGCFPATPQRALNLGEAGHAEEAVWYDCRLLRFMLEETQRSPDLSDEAVCGAIEALAAAMDGVELSQKRMQTHFAFVLLEYMRLWKTLEDPCGRPHPVTHFVSYCSSKTAQSLHALNSGTAPTHIHTHTHTRLTWLRRVLHLLRSKCLQYCTRSHASCTASAMTASC
jgi:hypothetical protein